MSLFLKFGVLFMRTVAKPVSNMVKSTVKDHPTFRAIAVAGARLHSRTNARWDRVVRRKPIVDKKGNPINRRELTENEAIDLAADMIGEVFLLYVAPLQIKNYVVDCGGKEVSQQQDYGFNKIDRINLKKKKNKR